MTRHARFAVLGAGPSGSALAAYLARAGQDVLLIDRDPEPRDGVGESLVPLCAPILDELEVDMSGLLVKYGAVFERGDEGVRFDFRDATRVNHPCAWQAPRVELDTRMRAAAKAAGVRFHFAKVRDIKLGSPRIVTDDGEITADFVIDAMGRGHFLGRRTTTVHGHPVLRNAAQTAWFKGIRPGPHEQPGDVAIVRFEGGWFWFIPFADGHWSAGVVSEPHGPRGDWEEALRRCPAAAERFREAERVCDFRGAADFTASATSFYGPDWALIGDAATFLDPVFSTGIAIGLWGAKWLSEALCGRLELADYEARVRDAISVFEPVVLSFYSGRFLDVAFSSEAQSNDAVRKAVVSLLAGDVFDPDFRPSRRMAHRIDQLAARLAG